MLIHQKEGRNMDDETLVQLNDLKRELDISSKSFDHIISIALEYQQVNKHITNEELVEIIKETMMVFDYCRDHANDEDYSEAEKIHQQNVYGHRKTVVYSFNEALRRLGYASQDISNRSL